jgi:hypothetical protein
VEFWPAAGSSTLLKGGDAAEGAGGVERREEAEWER